MSRSSSIGSLEDLDRHPLIRGVPNTLPHTTDWLNPDDNTQNGPKLLDAGDDSQDVNYEDILTEKRKIKVLFCHIPLVILNSLLVFLTIFFMVMMTVTLPLYNEALVSAGSDPYNLLLFASFWFQWIFFLINLLIMLFIDRTVTLRPTGSYKNIFFVGLLNTVNGLLVVYASNPDRTPPYLQAVLSTTSIPFTIAFRYLILKKGVSWRRLGCAGAVLVGLFISSEPDIFGMTNNSGVKPSGSLIARILWPIVFALGFVPVGLINTLIEKEMKKSEVESLSFLTWTQVVNFLTTLLLFWTIFIPGFGMVSSFNEFWEHFKTSLNCHFGIDPSCHVVIGRSWLFIAAYIGANFFMLVLTRYAEGAVFTAIVNGMVTPFGAIFWSIFSATPDFHWSPKWTITTSFTMSGLVIMVPAVILYNYFSVQDAKEAAVKKQTLDNSPSYHTLENS